jgi:hypothetical protein
MDITVPVGCTSVTLAVSGVKGVSGGKITGVDEVEGTQMVASYNRPKVSDMVNPANGTCNMVFPLCITSLTINGQTIAVVNGLAQTVNSVNLTAIFNQCWINAFRVA